MKIYIITLLLTVLPIETVVLIVIMPNRKEYLI